MLLSKPNNWNYNNTKMVSKPNNRNYNNTKMVSKPNNRNYNKKTLSFSSYYNSSLSNSNKTTSEELTLRSWHLHGKQ